MEDIWQESVRKKGAAVPMGSSLGQWWVPVGAVDADLEDGEVTLKGGMGQGPCELLQWPAGAP